MMRNLDMAALRAIVQVVDAGGVGRAAEMLNLTQSAVSMQLKRLEDTLDAEIFRREGRKLIPTGKGEELIDYARKILRLNDEAYSRMTSPIIERFITLGVPSDLVVPHVSNVLNLFAKKYPRTRIQLKTDSTRQLLKAYQAGELDLTLTTEAQGTGYEITRHNLIWMGAQGGQAAFCRPLPILQCRTCSFLPVALTALEEAEIEFERGSQQDDFQILNTMVEADMGVRVELANRENSDGRLARIDTLPKLPDFGIYLYKNSDQDNAEIEALAGIVSEVYRRG